MYKKILVPLDGSALGECTLEHVKAVAKGCNVPDVVLLSVVTSVFPTGPGGGVPAFAGITQPPDPSLYAKADKEYEAWLKSYLDKVGKSLQRDGVTAKTVVLKGNAAEGILDYAAKNNVDLIIMSTHGRSGPARWALGSVADRVVRLSTCPVMIVRHPSCVAP